MVIGTILIFLAFVAIGLHLSKRDKEVQLHDEVIQEKGKKLKTSKTRYYLQDLLREVPWDYSDWQPPDNLDFRCGGVVLVGEKMYRARRKKGKCCSVSSLLKY